MDRLTAVFRTCTIDVAEGAEHPAGGVVREVWSVLSALANKYQDDRKVIERICRFVNISV